jgi:hypothetical protein
MLFSQRRRWVVALTNYLLWYTPAVWDFILWLSSLLQPRMPVTLTAALPALLHRVSAGQHCHSCSSSCCGGPVW